MALDDLSSKVSHGVGELRDRAADAISADGESIFRSLRSLSERIDGAEATLASRITDAEANLAIALEELAAQKRRTTWPRRLFWLLAGAGAVAAFVLSAPDRVKELREQLLG